jgi:Flp pilus assembly CpaE family ATPase
MLIVNRYMKSADLKIEDLAEVFERPVSAIVGNDYRTMIESISTAKTVDEVHPKSVLNHDIKNLAGMLAGVTATGSHSPLWKRLLARWSARSNGKRK